MVIIRTNAMDIFVFNEIKHCYKHMQFKPEYQFCLDSFQGYTCNYFRKATIIIPLIDIVCSILTDIGPVLFAQILTLVHIPQLVLKNIHLVAYFNGRDFTFGQNVVKSEAIGIVFLHQEMGQISGKGASNLVFRFANLDDSAKQDYSEAHFSNGDC